MNARRGMRSVAIACAVAVGALGLGIGAASAQQIDPAVKNVKKVKEPKNCPEIPGVSATEVKVGSIAPMTGPSAGQGFFPTIIDGAQARFDFANANKELGNRKLTLIPIDDKGEAAQNLSAAQNLVEQEKVYAILAESAQGAASAPYLSQKGVPVVGWQLGLPIFGQYTNYFGFQNANAKDIASNYTTRNAVVVDKLGGKKVALVAGNTGNSAIFIEQIADAIKRFGKGMTVAYKTSDIPVGNTEWGSYAQQIKDSGADTMYTGLSPTDNIGLVTAMKQAGTSVKNIVLSAGYDPRLTSLAALDGTTVGIEFKPLETTPAPKGIADFKTAMAQYKPSAPVNQSAAVGWLSANTLIEGIKAAGVNCPTQKGFINNLRLVKDYTADGFFDPIDFQQVFNKPFQCVYYVKLDATAKAYTPLFNGEKVCGDIIKNNKLVAPTATTVPAASTPTVAR
jgi:branched-chain amino acid transport system substrate-binding protein